MNIQEAKQIKIADYLQSLGHRPVKQQGANLWYKSPLRNESEASFKVNTMMNSWFDFGMGKGGNIITLASYLYASDSLPYLLDKMEKQAPHVRPTDFSFPQQASEPSFERLEVRELNHPALLRYLSERNIDLCIARKECVELHFSHNGKSYFAIGFKNKSGGYEVRNRFFKGCMSPKDITHIRQYGKPRQVCYVFEGMMDYLSFLSLRLQKFPTRPSLEEQDYMILNSTSNAEKAADALQGYERVSCLLDNDAAGRKATSVIENALGYRVRDASHLYAGYNDLNDYLCGVKSKQTVHQVQSVQQTTPPRKKGAALRR